MHDRLNQIVLGTYIATFIFSLLVLRTVKSEGPVHFIPNISILFTLLISVGSIILLVIFIHHISMSIQADQIIADISEKLDISLQKLFPPESKTEIPIKKKEHLEELIKTIAYQISVKSKNSGYLQTIHFEKLVKMAESLGLLIIFHHRPGDFIVKDSEFTSVYSHEKPDEKTINKIRDAFILGQRRTPLRDPEFAINQMVEIASRALSPGINDPYTAIACIDQLTAAMCYLTGESFPPAWHYDEKGNLRLVTRPFTFEGLMDSSFNQIRQYGGRSPSVIIRMMEAFLKINRFAGNDDQKATIRKHADMIYRTAQITFDEPNDFFDLTKRYEQFNG